METSASSKTKGRDQPSFYDGISVGFPERGMFNKANAFFRGCICSIVSTCYRVRVAQSIDVTWNVVPIVITT